MMKRILALATLVMLGITSTASASVDIVGDTAKSTENLGNFAATLTYLATDNQHATLKIDMTNTSAAANGGYIVALAFVNPSNLINAATVASTSGTFKSLLGASPFQNDISVSPFGSLDIGVATGSDWLGGGSPTGGIAVGQTASFTFTFGALNGLLGLNEQSFLTKDAGSDYPFLVRFKGFKNDGSDKVPSKVVPEPASLAVWTLLGLAAIPGAVCHRRRKG